MKFILMSLIALFFTACAHHRDVRPGADGVHRVMFSTEDKEEGTRQAIDQANYFCEKRGKAAAFVEEKQTYTGDLKEDDYKAGKKMTQVAKAVGGLTYTLGGRKESNAGGVVGLGGIVGDAVLGKGYTVDMKFKCQ